MAYVMVCVAGTGIMNHHHRIPVGQFLKSFDPEAHRGRGSVEWTDDPTQAMQFVSAQTVMDCWRTIPRSRPVRDDGRPNRPLTAFTIVVDQI